MKKNSLKTTGTFILNMLRQIFEIRKAPNLWGKSIGAAICTGAPMLLGLLFNQPLWSSIGGLGSFAYLYCINETYYRRAKKMFYIVIGFTITVFLGTLAAPYPILATILLGLIGMIGTFTFGVLRIPGPAAIFFVLIYLITTSIPTGHGVLLEHSIIVFLSASFSMIVSMVGALFEYNGPETTTLKNLYIALANFGDAIGKENLATVRNKTVNSLKEAEETLLTAHIPWKESLYFIKLSLLYEQANLLFIQLLDLSYDKEVIFNKEVSNIIREMAKNIRLKNGKTADTAYTCKNNLNKIYLNMSRDEQLKYKNLFEILKRIDENINTPLQDIKHNTKIRKISKKFQMREALNKESIVFQQAVRYGIIIVIASIISKLFPFYKPYWIPLSCASVMLGSTIIGTFNRAVQRFVGTFLGLGLAAVVLNLNTGVYQVIILGMILTAITQLIIGKNYALAVIFITANSILIAENNAPYVNPEVFMNARITDVAIGSVIGLIGIFFMARHSASIRLKNMLIKLLQSQLKVLEGLVSNKDNVNNMLLIRAREEMLIDLTNFKTTYTTALGEIGGNKETLETMWPIVFSLDYISYLLEYNLIREGYLSISDDDMNIIKSAYESIILTVDKEQLLKPIEIPIIEEIPKISNEINTLQDVFSKRLVL